MWLQPPQELLDALLAEGHKPAEALLALRNVMLVVLPFVVMADRQDLSGQVDVTRPGAPAVFIYDRFVGGVGYARAGYDRVDDLLAMCRALIEECGCAEGCPSCVGSVSRRQARRIGFDAEGGFLLPGKAAVKQLLQRWLGDPQAQV
jgi:DEAD/DEAH box helicase domain-containing protein